MVSHVLFESSTISIVCTSDTHNDDASAKVPLADVFIHAGDMTDNGTLEELTAAFNWIKCLPHRVKVIVAGNHDLGLDPNHSKFSPEAQDLFKSSSAHEHGIHYLDRETREVARYQAKDGEVKPLLVYGNPCQPDFLKSSYCFTYLPYPDPSSERAWKSAPDDRSDDVKIWVTHSPPKDRLDAIPVPPLTGCEVLAGCIAKTRPLLPVFGHYHSSYGVEKVRWKADTDTVDKSEVLSDSTDKTEFDFSGPNTLTRGKETLFVNAAWMTMEKNKIKKRNMPWLINLDLEGKQSQQHACVN